MFVFDDFFAVEGLNKVGKDLWYFFLLLVGDIKLLKSLLDELFDKLMEKLGIFAELLVYFPYF